MDEFSLEVPVKVGRWWVSDDVLDFRTVAGVQMGENIV